MQKFKASLEIAQIVSVEAPASTVEAAWQLVSHANCTAPLSASVSPDQLRQNKAPKAKQDVITLETLISDCITTWNQQPPNDPPPPSTCQLWQLCCDQVVCGMLHVSVSVSVSFSVFISVSISVSVSVSVFNTGSGSGSGSVCLYVLVCDAGGATAQFYVI